MSLIFYLNVLLNKESIIIRTRPDCYQQKNKFEKSKDLVEAGSKPKHRFGSGSYFGRMNNN